VAVAGAVDCRRLQLVAMAVLVEAVALDQAQVALGILRP